MRSEDQRAAKLLAVKFGSLKKVYHPAMAIVEPLGSSFTLTGQGVLRSKSKHSLDRVRIILKF